MDTRSKIIVAAIGIMTSISIGSLLLYQQPQRHGIIPTFEKTKIPPLMMEGGDPHIRALMRMISASESNDRQPYSVLYGGSHVVDLSRHPEKCIRIVNGPNMNNCSTAAGRYQMINTTWGMMAKKYHPNPDKVLWMNTGGYSFHPEYQDAVVHAWLSDEKFWGMNISQLLKDGELTQVRKRLSSTWTSLGYGIENNTMTPELPRIYERLIREELVRKS